MVREEDLEIFDSKVKDVKVKAVTAMTELLPFIGMEVCSQTSTAPEESSSVPRDSPEPPNMNTPNSLPHNHHNSSPPRSHILVTSDTSSQHLGNPWDNPDGDLSPLAPYGSLPAIVTTRPAPVLNVNLHVVPQHSEASASWEQLQENIVELNDLVHQFASEVEQQGEQINCIEDNIEHANISVKEATTSLAKASKYKSALYPAVGAVIGGVVGGPVGFLAGLKLGAAAGALGGVVGFAGGRYLKKRQTNIDEIELSNLSENRSASLPDLTSESNKTSNREKYSSQEGKPLLSNQEQDSDSGVVSTMTAPFRRLFSTPDAPS